MYTPHTVTVYNVYEDPLTLVATYNATILRGVFLDVAKGTNVKKTGMQDADAATLFIPFSVKAVDGVTGEEKKYIGPNEFFRLADKSGYWTLETGGRSSSADCFFVKGEIVTDKGYGFMRSYYDDVFDVTTVDVRDFGTPDMHHWQVGGT